MLAAFFIAVFGVICASAVFASFWLITEGWIFWGFALLFSLIAALSAYVYK